MPLRLTIALRPESIRRSKTQTNARESRLGGALNREHGVGCVGHDGKVLPWPYLDVKTFFEVLVVFLECRMEGSYGTLGSP